METSPSCLVSMTWHLQCCRHYGPQVSIRIVGNGSEVSNGNQRNELYMTYKAHSQTAMGRGTPWNRTNTGLAWAYCCLQFCLKLRTPPSVVHMRTTISVNGV